LRPRAGRSRRAAAAKACVRAVRMAGERSSQRCQILLYILAVLA
jgi:hypothetical protein